MLDYYNFDYTNEKEIEKQIKKIDKDLPKYFRVYKTNYEYGHPVFNISIFESDDESKFKVIAPDYAKDAAKLATKDNPLPKDWEVLGSAEKAKQLSYLISNMQNQSKAQKLKADKLIEPIILENKEQLDNITNNLMFLLRLRTEAYIQMAQTTNRAIQDRLSKKADSYLAKIETLIDAKTVFENANASIEVNREMDLGEKRIKSNSMILADISSAKYLLEQASNPTDSKYKNKKHLFFALCKQYSILEEDKAYLDNVINITKAKLTKEINDAFKENEKKIDFLKKILQGELSTYNETIKETSEKISKIIDEEKVKNTSVGFFSRFDYIETEAEKLAVLQALRLSTITTLEELKDYLIYNRNEIKMEKTPEGKVEITIARSSELDSKLNAKNNSTIENKYMGVNSNITYVYDPINMELEGYKLSGQMYAFSKDIQSSIGKNLSNQFNTFLGNLETTTKVPVLTLFNIQIPVPSLPEIDFEVAKFKDKLTKKISDDFSVDVQTQVSAGTVKVDKLLLKPSALEASLTPEIVTKNYKFKFSIKESVKSFFKENTSFADLFKTKLASTYIDASMNGFLNDVECIFKKSDIELVKVNYDKTNHTFFFVDPQELLNDKKKMLNDLNDKVKLLYSLILGDSNAVSDILSKNSDIVSDTFNDKSKFGKFYEAFAQTTTSFGEVKDMLVSLVDSKDTLKDKNFGKIFDQFKKNESIFTINDATFIDDSLIKDKLLLLLSLNTNNNDIKTIKTLLEKSKEPEIFNENITSFIYALDNFDNKNYLSNSYSKIMENRFIELINDKNDEKIYSLLSTNKFNKEILSAFKSVKKKDAIKSLSNLTKMAQNDNKELPLDEVIAKYQKGIKKQIEKDTEQER